MKKIIPVWVYFVAIGMFMVGGCGIINGVQSVSVSPMLDAQEKMMDGFSSGFEELDENLASDTLLSDSAKQIYDKVMRAPIKGFGKAMSSLVKSSDDGKVWMKNFGFIGLGVSLIYIIGAIFLFIPRKFSIPLAYSVLGLSILFTAVKIIVLSNLGVSVFYMSYVYMSVLGIVFDLGFGVTILACDKHVYSNKPDPNEPRLDLFGK